MKNQSSKKLNNSLFILSTSVLLFAFLMLFLKLNNFAPFGGKTLAIHDANIQYLDFFSYLKDVFSGKNSVRYSFTIGMGQSGVGVLAYYLMSPFNLLLFFFDKSSINSFFDISVICKITMCYLTMSVFLIKRFRNELRRVYVVILGLSYALMQYNISQAGNLMWLDGVYMLPLIMLGIYYLINKKNYIILPVAVALSIIFSWYTAGMNCLFSMFYFLFELCLYNIDEKKNKFFENIKVCISYGINMLIGVLISCFIFYPNLIALGGGKGSGLDWNDLNLSFKGNPLKIVYQYSIGAVTSAPDETVLFAGAFVLIGVCALIYTEKNKLRRVVEVGMLSFVILCFFWQPLFMLFSLLKRPDSYWSRYAYLGVFILVFLAGDYFRKNEIDSKVIFRIVIAYSLIMFIIQFAGKPGDIDNIYLTVIFAFLIYVSIRVLARYENKNKRLYRGLCIILTLVSFTELMWNAKLISDVYCRDDVEQYKNYYSQNKSQIDSIKDADPSLYRITQNSTRVMKDDNITSYFDEDMGIGYMGIASYTSAPENEYLTLMNNLGYREEAGCVTVVDYSVTPADSLLGVKYVLSKYDIPGHEALSKEEGQKGIYKNPYALPFGIVYNDTSDDKSESVQNPFEYTNSLYRELSGENTDVYKPLEYEVADSSKSSIVYKVSNLPETAVVYLNMPWESEMEATVNLNNKITQGYAKWLSPSVVYVPHDTAEAEIRISGEDLTHFSDVQLYYMDTEEFGDLTERLKQSNENVTMDAFQNGLIECSVYSEQDGNELYIPVIASKGWQAEVNGKSVEIKKFASSMMSIPLDKGDNKIVIKYSMPGEKAGVLLSCVGIFLLVISNLYFGFRRRKECSQ